MTWKKVAKITATVLYAFSFLVCFGALFYQPGKYSTQDLCLMGFIVVVGGIRWVSLMLEYLEGKWES